MKKYNRENGITGLETAIILIAFVVSASVLSYVLLSTGMFSSQKSQEAVYSGVKSARNALQLKGSIIARTERIGPDNYISQFTFTVAHVLGGDPIDFTSPLVSDTNGKAPAGSLHDIVISYIDSYQKIDDIYWTCQQVGHHNGNNVLDDDEMLQIEMGNIVSAQDGGNLIDALSAHLLGSNTKFTIEVKTSVGATLTIERTTPSFIDSVVNLDTSSGFNGL
jgi:archaeal flagellin FlaB